MSVHFTVRRQVAADYGHRSRGGPVTVYARAIHAQLYGLPADNDDPPVALDELLQAAHSTNLPEQQAAILGQLAEQLRNATEILEWARNHAHWRRLPAPAWEWLRDATDRTRDLADGLDTIRPAFTDAPAAALASPSRPAPPRAETSSVVAPPTAPAVRHR
ncbi:hypothetical protein [Streptomyces sp. NPDC002564]|uniref:hypothetical protein n=1 Tax=Streptomyces sp. NPDC002564 TaxID=3364649 RepID=UPI0036B3EA31